MNIRFLTASTVIRTHYNVCNDIRHPISVGTESKIYDQVKDWKFFKQLADMYDSSAVLIKDSLHVAHVENESRTIENKAIEFVKQNSLTPEDLENDNGISELFRLQSLV